MVLYYRCQNDNDKSVEKCPIGHVNAREIENLVIEKISYLTQHQDLVAKVIDESIKSSKGEIVPLDKKKKAQEELLSKINKKLDNLIDLIADGANNRESLVKRLDEYENQKNQIENNISQIGFKINELSSKLISHDAVMANLKFFNEVFGQLPGNKKKELLRLLIKKIIIEGFNGKVNGNGNGNKKKGKIKMSLWDVPTIGPLSLDSASFAESDVWLPVTYHVDNKEYILF